MPGVQCVFGSTSIGRRVSTKGKESLVSVTQNGFRVINATNRAQGWSLVNIYMRAIYLIRILKYTREIEKINL